jgi:hypothetical protein
MKSLIYAAFLVMLASHATPAQIRSGEKCSGRIYNISEVTQRASTLEGPDWSVLTRGVPPGTRGVFLLKAVLCRTGHVTDIEIVKGLSPDLNEIAAAAVSVVKFAPAEFRSHTVSQRMSFELRINDNPPGIRLVEGIEVVGHRRLTTEQILSWIKTRPGEPYSGEQIQRDFEAVLATRNFDKTQTRVIMEDGVRGGVVLTFMVVELPLVGEIKFEGLELDPSVVFDAWKKEHIDLRSGGPYDAVAIKAAARIIKKLLDANGQNNSQVDVMTEILTPMKVNVTFVIKPN